MAKREMTEAQKAAQFKKGQSGNPSGISRKQAVRIRKNAEKALDIRRQLLLSIDQRIKDIVRQSIDETETEEQATALAAQRISSIVSSDVNTLLRDTESRHMGNPTQPLSTPVDNPLKMIHGTMTLEEAKEAYEDTVGE